jgi:hypothetical protein
MENEPSGIVPEGVIEIDGGHNGIPAGAKLYFAFSGDWSNMYDDEPESEREARAWFVREVQEILEENRREARQDEQTERSSDTENRGART